MMNLDIDFSRSRLAWLAGAWLLLAIAAGAVASPLLTNAPGQVPADPLAGPQSPNLLLNGGFENGHLDPWLTDENTLVSTNLIAPFNAAEGVYCLFPPGVPHGLRISQTVATEPGVDYALSLAFRAGWGVLGEIALEAGENRLDPLHLDGLMPDTTWGYATRNFTATGTQTEITITVPPDLGFRIFLDDIQLIPAAEAGAEPEILLEVANGAVLVHENGNAVIVVRRSGGLERRAFGMLLLDAETAEVNGPAPDLVFTETGGDRLGLTFEPHQNEARVVIGAVSDAFLEQDERAVIRLLPTGNARVEERSVPVIVRNLQAEVFAAQHDRRVESEPALGVSLWPVNPTPGQVRISTTAEGTAIPGVDFEPIDRIVSVAQPTTVAIPLLNDSLREGNETIVVLLEGEPWGTRVTPQRLFLTIADDEPVLTQAELPSLVPAQRASGPAIADVNRDSLADIVVALESADGVAVLLGRPGGGFEAAAGSPFPVGSSPVGVAVANLDGDDAGNPDIAAVNRLEDSLTLLIGDGRGGFSTTATLPTGKEPRSVQAADFDGDGRPDLVSANYEDDTLTLFLSGGRELDPARSNTISVGEDPWGLAVADLNGDGTLDLACANRGDDNLSVLFNDGTGTFATGTSAILAVGAQPSDVTSADVNNDGYADLISADTHGQSITLWLGTGGGDFIRASLNPTTISGGFPRSIAAADFNEDGKTDLAIAHEHSAIGLLLGDGAGGFTPAFGSLFMQPGLMNSLAVGDLNGDGAPDVVGCGPDFGISVLLGVRLVPDLDVLTSPAREDASEVRIRFRRTTHLDAPLSFDVESVDHTARSGLDYSAFNTRVEFAAGQAETEIRTALIDDDFGQGTRRFLLRFTNPSLPIALPWPVAVTITDNDEPVQISLVEHQTFVPEESGFAVIRVHRSGSLTSDRVVRMRFAVEPSELMGRAAEPGMDFDPAGGIVEFSKGEEWREIRVPVLGNSRTDGSRGFRVRIFNNGDTYIGLPVEIEVQIIDDERAFLEQELSLTQFGVSQVEQIISLHGGGALVAGRGGSVAEIAEQGAPFNRIILLRLQEDGLPETGFGEGSGRVTIDAPEGLFGIWFDRLLRNGGVLLRADGNDPETILVRLNPDGSRDFTFGNNGVVRLPGFNTVLEDAPDGSLLLSTPVENSFQPKLRRLLANGEIDAGFAEPEYRDHVEAAIGPDGGIWMSSNGELMRLLNSGRRDPGVEGRHGVGLPKFDAAGRAYVQVWDPGAEPANPPRGAIERFLPDGTFDADYRPLPGRSLGAWQLEPDGSILVQTPFAAEIGADGSSRVLIDPPGDDGWQLSRVDRLDGETILLSWSQCWGFGWPWGGLFCSSRRDLLFADGSLLPVELPHNSGFSQGIGREDFAPGQWHAWHPSIRRAHISANESLVGLASTGVHVWESDVRIPLFRAGESIEPAEVEITIVPVKGFGPEFPAPRKVVVEIGSGKSEGVLEIPNIQVPGRNAMREFLVTLNSASGAVLSPQRSCQVWVLDDDSMPGPGELRIERYPGHAKAHAALLVLGVSPDHLVILETARAMSGGWHYVEENFWNGSPVWLRPVPIGHGNAEFFRSFR